MGIAMESSTEATELLQSLFTQPSQSGDLDLSGFTITIGDCTTIWTLPKNIIWSVLQ